MKFIKKTMLSIILACGLFTNQAAVAGIPVIDPANLLQSILEIIAWGQQQVQMLQQLQQQQQQYSALIGSRNLGNIVNNTLLQGVVPTNVAQAYNSINSGGFNNLTQAAKTLRSSSMFYNCHDRTGDDKTTCEAILNTNAQVQSYQQNALSLTTQRTQQIQSLQNQINNTQDPKAIAELQARIQAETTQVANDANRLALMNAMGETQRQAAEQALRERTLKMLASDAPSTAFTFVFTLPK